MCFLNAYVHYIPSICYSSIENLSFAININTFFFTEVIKIMFFCHFLFRCLYFILYYVCILSVVCYNVLKCFWSINWPIGQSVTDMTAIDRSNWKNIGLDHTYDRSWLVGHGPVRSVIVDRPGTDCAVQICWWWSLVLIALSVEWTLIRVVWLLFWYCYNIGI